MNHTKNIIKAHAWVIPYKPHPDHFANKSLIANQSLLQNKAFILAGHLPTAQICQRCIPLIGDGSRSWKSTR